MLEKLKKMNKSLSIRKFFAFVVFSTFLIVIVLSIICIWGGTKFRNYLVPNSNDVVLTLELTNQDGQKMNVVVETELGSEAVKMPMIINSLESSKNYISLDDIEIKVVKVENSIEKLTPKRKFAYQATGVLMVLLPLLFSISGILIAGFVFYKRKLKEPLRILSNSMQEIAKENLDFNVFYESDDEMGALCSSFEEMRKALEENYKELWKMIEERKILQTSVAHDLRNPITIIKGYTEYLQENLEHKDLSNEKIIEIINNINKTTERLENYTNSIRAINQLDEIKIERKEVSVKEFIENACNDFSLMTKSKEIKLEITDHIPNGTFNIDVDVVYRIVENIINNALRYAKEKIKISFEIKNNFLIIIVKDDGIGFSENVLSGNHKLIISNNKDGHYGMGLTISRILCNKHGGELKLDNDEKNGAKVIIKIQI